MNREYFILGLTSAIDLGIPLADMGSVIQFETSSICTVPGVASFWCGVINFKGSLLWVLDCNPFFNLEIPPRTSSRLTAVILQNQQSGNQNRVALVAQKLKGIVSVESSRLLPLTDNVSAQLRDCCSAITQIEGQEIYIIDSAASLQRLQQQSSLVSV